MNEGNKVVGIPPRLAKTKHKVKPIMKGYQNVKTDQGVIRVACSFAINVNVKNR